MDWNDDKNIIAGSYAKILKNEVNKITEEYPQKAEIVKKKIQELSEIEKKNILKPDLPAKCCGDFYGEIFAPFEDKNSEKLKRLGSSLGIFIYILDACIDLKEDIKHKRYNPLIQSSKEELNNSNLQ